MSSNIESGWECDRVYLYKDPPVGRDPVFSVVAIRDLRKLPGWFCLIQNKRAPMTDLQRESSMDIEVAVTELGKTRVVPWEGVRIFGRVEKGKPNDVCYSELDLVTAMYQHLRSEGDTEAQAYETMVGVFKERSLVGFHLAWMGSEDVARDAKVGHGYISKSGRVPMRQIGVRAGDLTEGTADEPIGPPLQPTQEPFSYGQSMIPSSQPEEEGTEPPPPGTYQALPDTMMPDDNPYAGPSTRATEEATEEPAPPTTTPPPPTMQQTGTFLQEARQYFGDRVQARTASNPRGLHPSDVRSRLGTRPVQQQSSDDDQPLRGTPRRARWDSPAAGVVPVSADEYDSQTDVEAEEKSDDSEETKAEKKLRRIQSGKRRAARKERNLDRQKRRDANVAREAAKKARQEAAARLQAAASSTAKRRGSRSAGSSSQSPTKKAKGKGKGKGKGASSRSQVQTSEESEEEQEDVQGRLLRATQSVAQVTIPAKDQQLATTMATQQQVETIRGRLLELEDNWATQARERAARDAEAERTKRKEEEDAIVQMTQKKEEALAACSDSGQEALMKAIWTLEANMLHRLRRMENRIRSQDKSVADLASKLQMMKADISTVQMQLGTSEMNTSIKNSRRNILRRMKLPWKMYEDMQEAMNVESNQALIRQALQQGRDTMYTGQDFLRALFHPTTLYNYIRKFNTQDHQRKKHPAQWGGWSGGKPVYEIHPDIRTLWMDLANTMPLAKDGKVFLKPDEAKAKFDSFINHHVNKIIRSFFESIHIVWLAFYEKAKGRQYTRLALLIDLYDTACKIFAIRGEFPIGPDGSPPEDECKAFYKKWVGDVLEVYHTRGKARVFKQTANPPYLEMDTVPKTFIPWNTDHPDIAEEYSEKNRSTAGSERDKLVERWLGVAETHLDQL